MSTMKRWTLLAMMVAAMLLAACGQSGVQAEEPWARPAAIGANSAAYLILKNHGSSAVRLVGVSCSAAAAELHRTVMKSEGVMGMEPAGEIEILPGGELLFEPGGLHVMLVGLGQPLTEGDVVALTFEFDDGQELLVDALVRQP